MDKANGVANQRKDHQPGADQNRNHYEPSTGGFGSKEHQIRHHRVEKGGGQFSEPFGRTHGFYFAVQQKSADPLKTFFDDDHGEQDPHDGITDQQTPGNHRLSQFIRQRVKNLSQFRFHVEFAGDNSVHHVGGGRKQHHARRGNVLFHTKQNGEDRQ